MSPTPLKIGILETGRLSDELSLKFGDYPTLFTNWLAPVSTDIKSYAVLNGDFPDNPMERDLWVITGSRSGAYDDLDWIPMLEQFVRDCRDAGQKMLGICFGHQIIAQALGGQVEKSPKGWGLGVHEYATLNWPSEMGPAPDNLKFQAFHQDQVTRLADDSERIASSDFCENAALWYPGFALTVQGHPEFTAPFAKALTESRRGVVLNDSDVEESAKTVDRETSSGDLARLVRDNLDAI